MASSIREIREAIAESLAIIDGLQASPYMLANPTPPACYVIGPAVEYDAANKRGADWLTFKVQGVVSVTSDIGAQQNLDDWKAPDGPTSFKEAIEVDRTLGGLVANVQVVTVSEDSVYVREGGSYFGADWTLRVLV